MNKSRLTSLSKILIIFLSLVLVKVIFQEHLYIGLCTVGLIVAIYKIDELIKNS